MDFVLAMLALILLVAVVCVVVGIIAGAISSKVNFSARRQEKQIDKDLKLYEDLKNSNFERINLPYDSDSENGSDSTRKK